ncbi:kelch domain-containing protein 8A isoform X2 [Thalassophryne amazonica]|uniref:kelch domain-containing protein 8A isoform X2 n=1 Tax=Thalassophryne amazonica TaxID=390379 RepID=UPI0014719AEC|nr:kelch domain-containing protein 8A isoform X2 [Thalassophryne amazonica]
MAVPSAQEFHWQSLARLSSGRVYHTLSEVGGQMYILGGCDAGGRPCPSLELYSPEGDQWISLPPMPTPRAGAAVAVLGKQILLVGGVGEDQRPLKVVEMYNTDEGKWRKRSSLREALMGVSIIVKDARALAVGGMGGDLLPRSILQQYDLRKDMWAQLPPMLTPRYDANTHLLGSKVYVAGVWLKSEDTVAMKTKRADFVAAFLRGRMIVAGGLGHEPSALDTVEAFHPQRKKWERLAPMNFPRCSASSIVIRDRLLVVGGVNQVPSPAHEILYVKEEECL